MKKLLFCFISLVLLFTLSTTAFAGDVPEMLCFDDGQIFFAKITDYNEEKSSIEMIPVKTIKGDVKLGETISFNSSYILGDFTVKNNKAYLILFFPDNKPYIIRTTSYYTGNILLPDLKQDGMWGRLQTFLNDGTYDDLEIKRQSKYDIVNAKMQIEGKLPKLDNPINNTFNYQKNRDLNFSVL